MSSLHVTESVADRKKNRELAEARQSGTVAPAVDVKSGAMINPHNPEFITKRPWYLGGGDAGPSLEHQADQRPDKDKFPVTLADADDFLAQERHKLKHLSKKGHFQVGMWVEALKHNKQPYRICQIVRMAKKQTEFDLKYEDGSIERKVKLKQKSKRKPRIRMTKTGARSLEMDANTYGKESFDSKRDQYHGYELDSHNQKLEKKFQERDAIRKQNRQKEKEMQDKKNKNDGNDNDQEEEDPDKKNSKPSMESDSDLDSDVEDDDSDDEFVQRDEDARVHTSRLARQGGVGGAQMKVTARNLRIREDTAKYLRNLDPNSAYYDPKSRSMRDNPNPEIAADESQFAGDNFARISGDAVGLADTQLFAWEAADKGVKELHPQANPSQAELLKKQFKSKSANLALEKKKAVLEKYGGEEHLDGGDGLATAVAGDAKEKAQKAAQERQTRFGVSTAVEEYRPDGSLAKNASGANVKRVALKSKYEEDVLQNGHWTVWGSFFHKGAFQWGYADDHSLMKNSYCTGENGRKANDDANAMRYGTGKAGSAALAQAREMLKAIPATKRGEGGDASKPPTSSKMYGEADQNVTLDQQKVKEALKKVEKSKLEAKDDRKRKYNSLNPDSYDVTEEEMEAYRLRKETKSDPMANIGSDELLDYKK
ncbi:splicing factor SLU7 [Seminavis robusta]|uniref:Pre-mRNA-splicing factor SLU7 n=1 Tax=Seminavis robusta TaxID=568900 RepID=A0A9N8HR23_9STRA|nr:splicing factor SLU7 [Seminavis robusta]|eukprot:Sro1351_g265210.1 splicing factor SLU7 (654) ;mRNA; f:9254-11315